MLGILSPYSTVKKTKRKFSGATKNVKLCSPVIQRLFMGKKETNLGEIQKKNTTVPLRKETAVSQTSI